VGAELLELGVCTSDVAELSRPEFGKVRLSRCKYSLGHQEHFALHTYTSNLKIASFLPVRSSPVILVCSLYCGCLCWAG
jgi:hypothetical protein